MRALMFQGAGRPLALERIADPVPEAGEVVVKVGRCGICGTDLHMTEGHAVGYPVGAVPGHEFAGEIVALGKDVARLKIGDRVAVQPTIGCGTCVDCLAGAPAFCVRGKSTMGTQGIPGAFAEYALAGARSCIVLPGALGLDDGALVEPMAIGLRGVRQSGVKLGDKVLVIGAGPIGLATIFWAKRAGARVIATAASNRRAGLAQAMGADGFVLPEAGETLAEAARAALGGMPEIVFECVGIPGMVDLAMGCVGRRGLVVILGFCVETDHYTPAVVFPKEARVQFVMLYELKDYQITVDAFEAGAVAPRTMITDVVSLEEGPAAFEALRHRSYQCKVQIAPG